MSVAVLGSEIVVRLRINVGGPLAPSVWLRRPRDAVRVALERPPQDFLRLLPLLFPLCGTAHAVAGLRALEAAACIVAAQPHEQARRLLCLADALAAHAWRSEFDWTALVGATGRPLRVAAARRATAALARELYPDGDCMAPGGGRLAPTAGFASAWSATFRDIAAGLELDQHLAALRRAMAAALAGADPAWMVRLQSRFRVVAAQAVADAEALVNGLAALAGAAAGAGRVDAPLRDGEGEGCVDTARGELRYRVALRGGLVVDCSLDAPIDRVFGDGGEASRWLANLDCAARPEAAVRWVVAALDPCAPLRIEAMETIDA